jgi:hypothetical protein
MKCALSQLQLIEEILALGDPAEYHNALIRKLQELRAQVNAVDLNEVMSRPCAHGTVFPNVCAGCIKEAAR